MLSMPCQRKQENDIHVVSAWAIPVYGTCCPHVWNGLRCDHWSKDYFCGRVLFAFSNLFLLSFFRFSKTIVDVENVDIYSKHSLHIYYFVLLIFHFPAKHTLYNTRGRSWQKRRRGDNYSLPNRKRKLSTLAVRVSGTCSWHVWRYNKWNKDYFCVHILTVVHIGICFCCYFFRFWKQINFDAENVDVYTFASQ